MSLILEVIVVKQLGKKGSWEAKKSKVIPRARAKRFIRPNQLAMAPAVTRLRLKRL